MYLILRFFNIQIVLTFCHTSRYCVTEGAEHWPESPINLLIKGKQKVKDMKNGFQRFRVIPFLSSFLIVLFLFPPFTMALDSQDSPFSDKKYTDFKTMTLSEKAEYLERLSEPEKKELLDMLSAEEKRTRFINHDEPDLVIPSEKSLSA